MKKMEGKSKKSLDNNKINDFDNIEKSKEIQKILDSISIPFAYKTINSNYEFCNKEFMDFFEIENCKQISEIEALSNVEDGECSYLNSDNKLSTIVVKKKVLNEDDMISYSVIDITEYKKNQERMNRILKMNQAMISISNAIIEKDNIGDLLEKILEETLNAIGKTSIGAILLLDKEETLKIACSRGYKPEDVKDFSVNFKESFFWENTKGEINNSIIISCFSSKQDKKLIKTREKHSIKSVISAPIVVDGKIYGFINADSIHKDIFDDLDLELMDYMKNQIDFAIKRHNMYNEILFLSRYDNLTGIYRRNYFEQVFIEYFKKHEKQKTTFKLINIDLDDLKAVNDLYGHDVGDLYIKYIVEILKIELGNEHVFARIGGDEYIVLIEDLDLSSIYKTLKSIKSKYKTMKYKDNKIPFSFSYGVSIFPKDSTDKDKILKIADERMYKMKKWNKNT